MRILLLLCIFFVGSAWAQQRTVVIPIEGAIGPATSDYVETAMEDAVASNAALIVLRLDTPGGLDQSMRAIIRDVLDSPIPVVAYVAPSGARAASAGTYILYAAHVAAMAPGTNLGAATPVQVGGGDTGGEDGSTAMERKMTNDAAAYIRALADLRGRNAEWAERAVRQAESLSAREALAANVVDFVAEDLGALFEALDGRVVEVDGREVRLDTSGLAVEVVEPGWRTELLSILTNPNVAYVLMLLGVYGLIFELANPGALVPGVLGGICLLLALFAFQTLPINYAGLGLIVLGLVFFIGEAFVPSFGILGVGGVIAFVFGSVILLDTDSEAFEISMALIGGLALTSLLMTLATISLAMRVRSRPVVSGGEQLIGSEAEVLEGFIGAGMVRVHGEMWRARTVEPLRQGERVRVVARDGLILTVVRKTDPSTPAGAKR